MKKIVAPFAALIMSVAGGQTVAAQNTSGAAVSGTTVTTIVPLTATPIVTMLPSTAGTIVPLPLPAGANYYAGQPGINPTSQPLTVNPTPLRGTNQNTQTVTGTAKTTNCMGGVCLR
jgi:hypothetical protein